jgi:menaquinone-dependent protoporphyrinogen oxidase
MKVIVVYASKSGFTRGIAEFLADKIRQNGIPADVKEADKVENPQDYDGFVIGSAVYMAHWMKEAREFVKQNSALLTNRPVWLFSSGPVGKETTDKHGNDLRETSVPKDIVEFKKIINPRDHHVFYGGLDGSRLTGTIALGYKMARMSKSAREAMPEGDFRDWNEIEAWATTIARELEPQKTAL